MIENPLELGGRFGGLTRRKVGLTANVDGIEDAEVKVEAEPPMARSKREALCSD